MWRDRAVPDAGVVAVASHLEPAATNVPKNRIPAGFIALALAVMVAVVVPAILDGGVVGSAAPAPLPVPPAVGSCVVLPLDGPPQPVRCDGLHDGEITRTWPAGTYPLANGGAEPNAYSYSVTGRSSRFTYFECFGWNSSYIGEDSAVPDGWVSTPPLFSGGLVYGSPDQHFSQLYWSACVVRPAVGEAQYAGTIRDAGARPSNPRPDVYMTCLSRPEFGATELIYSSCALPHRVEPIALDSDLDVVMPEADALARCREYVQLVTGAADPTYGGQLSIKIESVRPRTLSQEDYSEADDLQAQDCVVELAADGDLLGSVIGLGDRPLPLVG